MAFLIDIFGSNSLSGTNGHDKIYGLWGNDRLNGGGGRDDLYGGSGADQLNGQRGNDHLDGGAGRDTALLNGTFNDYSIARDGNDYIVTDLNRGNGNEGTDRLHDIERINLDGQTYGLGDFEETARTTLLPDSTNGNELWAGSGNTTTNFTIVENEGAGVEIGLKAKIRQGPDIVAEAGTSTYVAPTGFQDTDNGSQVDNAARAAWSFDFSVNGDVDDDGLPAGFIFRLDVDVDKSAATDFETAYEGTIAGSAPFFADGFFGAGTGVDNSQNYVFFNSLFPGGSPYDVNDEGIYDVRVSAFDSTTLLATTTIRVDVTDDFVA